MNRRTVQESSEGIPRPLMRRPDAELGGDAMGYRAVPPPCRTAAATNTVVAPMARLRQLDLSEFGWLD
jgi:hypothetical protein